MAWRSTRVLVGAAVAVAVLLILVDVRGSGPTQVLRGIAGAVAGPPGARPGLGAHRGRSAAGWIRG